MAWYLGALRGLAARRRWGRSPAAGPAPAAILRRHGSGGRAARGQLDPLEPYPVILLEEGEFLAHAAKAGRLDLLGHNFLPGADVLEIHSADLPGTRR